MVVLKMDSQTVNALELVMIMVYTVGRLVATCLIIWFLCQSDIEGGWRVFLIALTVIVGLTFRTTYKNPNDAHCVSIGQSNEQVTEIK